MWNCLKQNSCCKQNLSRPWDLGLCVQKGEQKALGTEGKQAQQKRSKALKTECPMTDQGGQGLFSLWLRSWGMQGDLKEWWLVSAVPHLVKVESLNLEHRPTQQPHSDVYFALHICLKLSSWPLSPQCSPAAFPICAASSSFLLVAQAQTLTLSLAPLYLLSVQIYLHILLALPSEHSSESIHQHLPSNLQLKLTLGSAASAQPLLVCLAHESHRCSNRFGSCEALCIGLPKLLRLKAVRIDKAVLEKFSWLISPTSGLGSGSRAFCSSNF